MMIARQARTLIAALLTAVPCAAAASTLDTFQEGMTLTLTQGVETRFVQALDPCLGAQTNCNARSYYTDAWVATDQGMDWPAVGGFGVSTECPADQLCLWFDFLPTATGHFDLTFDTSYERRTYLGGDDTGPEWVYADILWIGHSFAVNVVPATVPVPAAGLMLAAGLAAFGLVRRRRRA